MSCWAQNYAKRYNPASKRGFILLFLALSHLWLIFAATKEEEMEEEEIKRRMAQGAAFFRQGYNCAQAVALALADLHELDHDLLARMAGPFGGGIGRMREVCGAACGMFMMSGLDSAGPGAYPDAQAKKKSYEVVQRLAEAFREENGSIYCHDLLAKKGTGMPDTSPTPEARTPEYYAKRPCAKMVESAIRIYLTQLADKAED